MREERSISEENSYLLNKRETISTDQTNNPQFKKLTTVLEENTTVKDGKFIV